MYKAREEDYQKTRKLDFNNMDDFFEIRREAGNKITDLSNAAYERLKKKMS